MSTSNRSLFNIIQRQPIGRPQATVITHSQLSIIPGLGVLPDPSVPQEPSGAPTPSGTAPSTPPAPTNTDPLSSLNIPIAQQGLPITSDYHNSLRDAVMAIARHLGITQVSSGALVSFAPAFFPHWPLANATPEPPWALEFGFAFKPINATLAKGWMPISLPDGALIQSMLVNGAKSGTFTGLDIKLIRLPFAAIDLSGIVLIDINLKDTTTSPFSVTGQVQIPGSAAGFGTASEQATLQNLKLVDNSQYKYLVTAELTTTDATAATTAQIATIEIGIQL